jgi:hypothetical protein
VDHGHEPAGAGDRRQRHDRRLGGDFTSINGEGTPSSRRSCTAAGR